MLVVSVLGTSNATATAVPESHSAGNRLALVNELPPAALEASPTIALASNFLLARPVMTWASDDFTMSPTERQLLSLRVRSSAKLPEIGRAVNCAVLSCVALTFDDGPGRYTEALLAVLANHDVPATFFVVGRSVRARPTELLQIHAAGHEIGLHSDQHRRMPTLSNTVIARDFQRSRQTLFELAGIEPDIYRPPYGMHSSRVGKLANAAVIMWDVDPQDWRIRNSNQITQRVLSVVQPGSIVVLHELEQTVEALNSLVAELIARDYTLVTVSEILGETPIHSKIYRSGVFPSELTAAD
jgi:peptidoglycan/xylan/chitin deacetylase (PgdA/CDA1 family)